MGLDAGPTGPRERVGGARRAAVPGPARSGGSGSRRIATGTSAARADSTDQGALPISRAMGSQRDSTHSSQSAARTGAVGTIVAAFAFFDGVFVGTPIALLAASLRPLIVFAAAAIAVSCLSIACSTWVNRRWDEWFSGNDKRIVEKLEVMRHSRLMRRPEAWIERGSSRQYALASALANPILVVAIARSMGGKPSERRIRLGSIAYAIPYVAMWTLLGLALGDAIRAS